MDGKVQAKELELKSKDSTLTQTEQDLANAVLLIQEREAELAKFKPQEPPPPPPYQYHDPEPINARPAPATDEEPINPPPKAVVIYENPHQIIIPDFSIGAEEANPVNAGFGDMFPKNPKKGDMFLRVDMLPSRLYKWNEKKWIEVDKTKTDSFAYDRAYIQHLVEKIDSGEYDIDLLSTAEQEQITRYLNEQSKH